MQAPRPPRPPNPRRVPQPDDRPEPPDRGDRRHEEPYDGDASAERDGLRHRGYE